MGQDANPRLSELSDLCDRQRKASRRPQYSEETKALVRDLETDGVGATALARAAGVSISAVRKWLGEPSSKKAASPSVKPVKVFTVERNDAPPDERRLVAMVRAADYEVAIYARERGRP